MKRCEWVECQQLCGDENALRTHLDFNHGGKYPPLDAVWTSQIAHVQSWVDYSAEQRVEELEMGA